MRLEVGRESAGFDEHRPPASLGAGQDRRLVPRPPPPAGRRSWSGSSIFGAGDRAVVRRRPKDPTCAALAGEGDELPASDEWQRHCQLW